MSKCPVEPEQVAAAMLKFVDLLERSGRISKPVRRLEDWQDPSEDWPEEELRESFFDLESALNPERRPYDDRNRVGQILAWAAETVRLENDVRCEQDAELVDREQAASYPIAGLAVGVDTILRWWGLEKITGESQWSVGGIGTLPLGSGPHLEKPSGSPPAIPQLMAEQMRAAGTALTKKATVQWPWPPRSTEPVTGATADRAQRVAGNTLMLVHHLIEDLSQRPETDPHADGILFYHFQLLRDAAGTIPGRGWEPVYPPMRFRLSGSRPAVVTRRSSSLCRLLSSYFAMRRIRQPTRDGATAQGVVWSPLRGCQRPAHCYGRVSRRGVSSILVTGCPRLSPRRLGSSCRIRGKGKSSRSWCPPVKNPDDTPAPHRLHCWRIS